MSKEVLTHSESYIKKTNRIILAVGITSFVVFLFGLYLLFSSDEPIDEYEEPVFTDNDDALNVVDNTPVQESIEFSTVGDTEVPLTTTPNPVPLGQVVLGTDAKNVLTLGTNGKTSTTEMTSEMLTACGLDAPTAGNIASGDMSMSLSRCATNPQHDVLCVELSSFQLHFTDSLALDCAAITNIADDHLDWHGGRENYAADKSKVFHNAKRAIVYNAQDAKVSELAAEAQTPQAGQIGIEDGWIVDRSGVAGGAVGESVRLAAITDFTHLAEPDGSLYPHLVADALTALALVLGLGADRDTALKALTSFKPGGHRIETVAEAAVEGGSVRFVDDSKATNGHAARASLSSFPAKSVIWIAGGLAKGSRFEDLVKDQAHTIKAAVIIGKDQQPMIEAFASQAPDIPVTIIDPEDNDTVMDRAVEACGTYAAAGDIVLMAPACASMDQFKSYADRGNRFAAAAKTWSEVHGLH